MSAPDRGRHGRQYRRFFGQHLARPGPLYGSFAGEVWRDVSAGELAIEIARWQAAFRREGLVPGDRVAICVRNGVDWVAIDLAALVSLVVVPLFVDDAAGNVAWCVADADVRLLVVEQVRLAASLARSGMLAAAADGRVARGRHSRPRCGGAPADRFLPREGGDVEIGSCSRGTLATICYTSGTAAGRKA